MGLCFLKHLKLLRRTKAPGFALCSRFCVWKAESADLVLLSHVRALETPLNPFASSKWKTNGPPPRAQLTSQLCPNFPPRALLLTVHYEKISLFFMKIPSVKSYALQPSFIPRPRGPEAAWSLRWIAPHAWTQSQHRRRSWNYFSSTAICEL